MSVRLDFKDSEGAPIQMHRDDQGDIWLCTSVMDRKSIWGSARFCGPGGDGGYAPNTKRALRALWDAMVADGALIDGCPTPTPCEEKRTTEGREGR